MDYFHSRRYLDTLPDWETGRPQLGPLNGYLPRMRQLLKRLGNPQQSFRSVIVGGSNGKGTVASLVAAMLRASGYTAGLYTQPHLHTVRERIQVQGALVDRDGWAAATSFLYDQTREFERDGFGSFSKFEAVTALAAHLFGEAEVQFGVFEVGLGGRFDATNAWNSELAILTPVALDHVDVLGADLLSIAADKVKIARCGHTLVTTPLQSPMVLDFLRHYCEREKVDLVIAETIDSRVRAGDRGEAEIRPQVLPAAAATGAAASSGSLLRPSYYVENAALAASAVRRLLGDGFDHEQARQVTAGHRWPGRFEKARDRPFVLLDGAHNPAAAGALADDLRPLSKRWTFVVGVNEGHDPAGIMAAVQPLADQLVLTSSDHPKAYDVDALEGAVPTGLDYLKVGAWTQALRQGLDGLGPDQYLCVFGSLHLVARAREFFNLPLEREGISEEVPLESLACIAMASQRSGFECQRVSDNDNVLLVSTRDRPLYFLRNKHPFNDYVSARLAEDKGYQFELFARSGLPTPTPEQIFNPFADDRFDRYKTHQSVDQAVDGIESRFSYPLLVKRYRSSVSQGVFLEIDGRSLRARMRILFENSGYLDNILLIQAFVRGPEYRVVASQGELLLAYEKQCEEGLPPGRLNPLHQATGRAVKVTSPERLGAMEELTRRVSEVIDLGFYAIDLIDGRDGFSILELNPNPFCFFYNRDNGREDFVSIYEFLLDKYVGRRAGTSHSLARFARGTG